MKQTYVDIVDIIKSNTENRFELYLINKFPKTRQINFSRYQTSGNRVG